MTNEEARNTLKSLKDYYNDKNEDSYVGFDDEDNEALDLAIQALEQQQDVHDTCKKCIEFSEFEQQPRWIPVSERLPEDGRTVLVWYEYFRYGDYNKLFQTYGLSYAYGGHWSEFVNGTSGWKDLRIMAWMPLPEPYKAESEE